VWTMAYSTPFSQSFPSPSSMYLKSSGMGSMPYHMGLGSLGMGLDPMHAVQYGNPSKKQIFTVFISSVWSFQEKKYDVMLSWYHDNVIMSCYHDNVIM
jgi:hypothetical protein